MDHLPARLLLITAAVFTLCACDAGGEPEPEIPWQPELDSAGWNEFAPGGDTRCARDTPYAYFVHPGTVNKLVVDFFGGGACWNQSTCSIADAIFEDSIDPIRDAIESESYRGIYDREDEANPFKDWWHVVLPYCTGDVHWGNSSQIYGSGPNSFVIEHKGAVNSRAVLDWVYANFRAPEQIFVTGCSAGSYGSALWSADIMRQYPDSRVVQFGDSGAGVITESFFADSFPTWHAEEAFPTWIPSLDPATNDLLDAELPDLYAGIAGAYPNQKMSQYNTLLDDTQVYYYEVMGGGDAAEWSALMLDSIGEIESRADNFCAYLAGGEQHCIVTRNSFFTRESDGVLLVDWLGDLLDGSEQGSVRCADCGSP